METVFYAELLKLTGKPAIWMGQKLKLHTVTHLSNIQLLSITDLSNISIKEENTVSNIRKHSFLCTDHQFTAV